MRIVADDKIPFLKGVLEPFADVDYVSGEKISNEIIKQADAILIRTRTHCNEELLKGSRVQFIGTATIGYDHIDTKYCEDHGIVWKNAPGCNAVSVEPVCCFCFGISGPEIQFFIAKPGFGCCGGWQRGEQGSADCRNAGYAGLSMRSAQGEAGRRLWFYFHGWHTEGMRYNYFSCSS